jgi:hypothetical protein
MKWGQLLIENWIWIGFFTLFLTIFVRKKVKKIYASRREAFRAAKRENGIPMGMQPKEVIYPHEISKLEEKRLHLDKRNVRLYVFEWFVKRIDKINKHTIYIREDKAAEYGQNGKGDQIDHFNAGKNAKRLEQHYYFKTQKTKWKQKSTWQKIYTLTKLLIWLGVGMSLALLMY